MTTRLCRWIIGLCVLGPGCSPLANVTRSLLIEPLQYCETLDDLVARGRNSSLANAAWDKLKKDHPYQSYSADYEDGFKCGFADYLYAGGTGAPPPFPPRQYWRPRYQTPEGYQAIQDWFAGFQDGAAVAQASGYRQQIPVPTSVAGTAMAYQEPLPVGHEMAPESAPIPPVPNTAGPTAPAPILPMPKPVVPAAPAPTSALPKTVAPAPTSALPKTVAPAPTSALPKTVVPASYTEDYEAGFKSGFADYLNTGGAGALPPLPPRQYWGPHDQTPESYQAIQYWFAGFREGAAVAEASGYRQRVPAPPSLPSTVPTRPELLPARHEMAPESPLPPPRPNTAGPASAAPLPPRANTAGPSHTEDYEAGFKTGFADYLYVGGTGAPPPLPPRQYWEPRYQTPQGYQAIQDWFAGFRDGAAVAQASGHRQQTPVPPSLPGTVMAHQEPSPARPGAAPELAPIPPVPNTTGPAFRTEDRDRKRSPIFGSP